MKNYLSKSGLQQNCSRSDLIILLRIVLKKADRKYIKNFIFVKENKKTSENKMRKLYPLTPNQTRLYHYQKSYPLDPSYKLNFLYKISGNLDILRLKQVIEEICEAIDILKVEFIEMGNNVFQEYLEGKKHEVEIYTRDQNESLIDFRQKVLTHFHQSEKIPAQINKWPLIKFEIFQADACENYLLFVCHHIIGDGQSYNLLIDAINKAYNNRFDEIDLKKFAKEYFDKPFLSEGLDINVQTRSHEYFLKETQKIQSFTLKKINQQRNEQLILEGNTSHFYIDKKQIETYLETNKISENSFFIAIYAIYLKKLTDENILVIGLPILNRNKMNKNVFGYLVNTLPLIIDFENINSFSDLIQMINKKIFSLIRNQSYDIGNLDKVDIKFNNYFTLYSKEFNYEFEACTVKRITSNKSNILTEFKCSVEVLADKYRVSAEFGEFFKDISIENIFKNLIHQVVKESEIQIKDIEILGINKENNSDINFLQKQQITSSIKDRFEQVTFSLPDKIALNDCKQEWTYKQLNQKANKVARYIVSKAANSEKIIISLNRNNYLIMIILAILKSGKCYVPIDLMCPAERFNYILQDLDNTFVIAEKEILERYQFDAEKFVSIENLLNHSENYDDSDLGIQISPESNAYMIYTSGSTGAPKGVEVSNKNLLSLLKACQEQFQFNNNDVWTLFHSYGFDFSVWEIFGCLLNGGKLIVVDHLTSKSPADYYEILSKFQVTVLNQTPTAFKGIIQEDSFQKQNLNLRYVIFGGEALYFPVLKQWVANHPLSSVKLINMYGITETTVHVTFYEINEQDLELNKSIIGKPLSHLGINIINSDGNLLPTGISGEIVVYGEGVTNGYYKKMNLTNCKFEKKENGMTYYKSGDLGKLMQDGNIEYLGRMDKQVQLRGYRIELGEIESHIIKTSLVKDCAVDLVNLDNGGEDQRLVAYIVPEKNYEQIALKTLLKNFLLPYMIPSHYISVEKIPTNVNGKIDLEMLKNSINKIGSLIKGKTQTEKFLFEIISSLIKNDNFSLDENLFDVGVTSIDLVSIFNRIKEKYLIGNISILDVFQFPTVEKLSAFIDKKNQSINITNLQTDRSQLRKNLLKRRMAS